MDAVISRNKTYIARVLSIKDYTIGLMMFIYITDFMSLGSFIPVLLFPVVTIYLFKNRFNWMFVISLISLLLFSVLYSLIMYSHGFIAVGRGVVYVLLTTVLFTLGHKLSRNDTDNKKILFYLYVVIVSYVWFGFSSLMNTILTYGNITDASFALGGRYVTSIWDDSLISATILNTTISLGIALLPIIFLSKKKNAASLKVKVSSLVCFVLSFYTILQLGNRTGFLIVVASVLTVFLFSKGLSIKKTLNFLGLTILFTAAWYLFNRDLFGIKTAWEGTILSMRFKEESLLENSRVTAWGDAFVGMFDNPLGGRATNLALNYAHNFWLDIGYEAGILPFLAIVLFTLLSVLSLARLIKSKQPLLIKQLFMALFVAFMVTFMMEPIMVGAFTYFTIFCFVVGIIQGINAKFKFE